MCSAHVVNWVVGVSHRKPELRYRASAANGKTISSYFSIESQNKIENVILKSIKRLNNSILPQKNELLCLEIGGSMSESSRVQCGNTALSCISAVHV